MLTFQEFESVIGYIFKDKKNLQYALYRRAYIQENNFALGFQDRIDFFNQLDRLSFLGNKLFYLAVATSIFVGKTGAQGLTEGNLTRYFERLIEGDALPKDLANRWKLKKVIRWGKGELSQNVASQVKVLREHISLLFAALYVDCQSFPLACKIFFGCDLFQILEKENNKTAFARYLFNEKDILFFQAKLDYIFLSPFWLVSAMLRQSAIEERIVSGINSFQVLEFLGDKVLAAAVAYGLYLQERHCYKGSLSYAQISCIHNRGPLEKVAKFLEIDKLLIMGRGENENQIIFNQKVLSDHMESLLGAIWIDTRGSLTKLKKIIVNLWQTCKIWPVERDFEKSGESLDNALALEASSEIMKLSMQETLQGGLFVIKNTEGVAISQDDDQELFTSNTLEKSECEQLAHFLIDQQTEITDQYIAKLISACKVGDLNKVLELEKEGVDIMLADNVGNTAFSSAVYSTYAPLVDHIVRRILEREPEYVPDYKEAGDLNLKNYGSRIWGYIPSRITEDVFQSFGQPLCEWFEKVNVMVFVKRSYASTWKGTWEADWSESQRLSEREQEKEALMKAGRLLDCGGVLVTEELKKRPKGFMRLDTLCLNYADQFNWLVDPPKRKMLFV